MYFEPKYAYPKLRLERPLRARIREALAPLLIVAGSLAFVVA